MNNLPEGTRILIVEDEVIVAMDVCASLEDTGVRIVGPAYTLAQAIELAAGAQISAAILDMRLRDDSVAPVARILADRGIPFVFYSGQTLADPLLAEWPAVPMVSKPATIHQLIHALAGLLN